MTILQTVLVESHRRGYRITPDGLLISPVGRGRTLRGSIDSEGYRYTNRLHCGTRQKLYFHRLQAYQKFGDAIFGENVVVRHLDGDKLNNKADNIAIGNQSDNAMDRCPKERLEHALKGSAVQKKLTDEQAQQLRQDSLNGVPYSELVKKYGISKSTVSYIVNNKTYKN